MNSAGYPFKLIGVKRLVSGGLHFILRVQVGASGIMYLRGFRYKDKRLLGPSIPVGGGKFYGIVKLTPNMRAKIIALCESWILTHPTDEMGPRSVA